MIKSITYWSMPGGLEGICGIEDAAARAKAAGFEGLELCVGESGVLTPSTDQATCEDYRRIVANQGLALETLASGMSWGCSPTDPDPAIRKKSIELHQGALQRAAWLGCSAMLFVPGAVKIPWDPGFGPVSYEQAVERAREAINALLPVAEATGVDLCIENVWNGLFYSPLEFATFIDSFDHLRLGVYFDVGNVLGYQQHPPHWITLLGDRIRRVHIKDFKCAVGTLDGFCDLLKGDVSFPEVMSALRAIGYDRTIVAEMMPPDDTLLQRTSRAMDIILNADSKETV
jgi:L-ribulose-5-phosphate 3-epimerase